MSIESVQFSSVAQPCPTLQPHGLQHARPPCPSPTPGVYSTHVHSVSDAIQPSHPLSSPSPSAFNLSQHQVFSNESAFHIMWPKYWSFSFSISPSNEYSGLISFRADWFDLLAVQGSQVASPAPQFKSISSSVLSLLYGPTLLSIHDYWESYSFDYMDLCWKSDLSAFSYAFWVCHNFSSKEQVS